jgi:site-specific recombinase XerD
LTTVAEVVDLSWNPFSLSFSRLDVKSQAGIPFPVHPHMLRHACGYYLASKGQDTRAIQAYLGHKNIQHTVRYTELAPGRFNDFWQD